jgi:hypothetical protein
MDRQFQSYMPICLDSHEDLAGNYGVVAAGGSLASAGGILEIRSSEFINNSAAGNGGAVMLSPICTASASAAMAACLNIPRVIHT